MRQFIHEQKAQKVGTPGECGRRFIAHKLRLCRHQAQCWRHSGDLQ